MNFGLLCGTFWFNTISMVFLKAASLILMGYVMIFLAAFGSLEDVGAYSALTSITAPVAMFLVFRYVEAFSMAKEKSVAFSLAITVSILGFVIASVPIYFALASIISNRIFIVLLLLWKPLELFGDMFVSVVLTINNRRVALRSTFLKLVSVISISMFGVLLKISDVLSVISVSLLTSFLLIGLIHDLPALCRSGLYQVPSFSALVKYIRCNFKFGVLNLLISFNSSLPRYFLVSKGDMAVLGLFTLIYQIAASLVNVLQFPISLRAEMVLGFMRRYVVSVRVLILALGLFLLAVVAILFISADTDDAVPGLLLAFLSVIVMAIFLLFRGALMSAAIAAHYVEHLYLVIIFSSALSIIFVMALRAASPSISELFIAELFVIASSYIAVLILFSRIAIRRVKFL